MFFSGNLFPLATPSNIELHIFLGAPSLLPGLLLELLEPIPETRFILSRSHFTLNSNYRDIVSQIKQFDMVQAPER